MTIATKRKYTAEYKREVVKLVTEQGYRITEAARNLGVNAHMLGLWKRESAEGEAIAFPGKGNRSKRFKRKNRVRIRCNLLPYY